MATSDHLGPPGTLTAAHNQYPPPALDQESYTFHRLKHASPDHLHLTTRRFFIGPIPQGWLSSNRKSWYRRRLELSNYSSRQVSFNVVGPSGRRTSTLAGFHHQGPVLSTPVKVSFPQPGDVDDAGSQEAGTESPGGHNDHNDWPQQNGDLEDRPEIPSPKPIQVPPSARALDGGGDSLPTKSVLSSSYHTANQSLGKESNESGTTERGDDTPRPRSKQFSTLNRFDTSSTTPLLQPGSASEPGMRTDSVATQTDDLMQQQIPDPIPQDRPALRKTRTPTAVRFNVDENVAHSGHLVPRKIRTARHHFAGLRFHRDAVQEGTIIKMERMLVKIYFTAQSVPRDFNENAGQSIDTRMIEKWREFMVVTRKSRREDEEDFRLQIYKTRVIPEIDNRHTRTRPTREIRLDPKTTHINLYSALDKSLVIWHPYHKGTRIVIMRPSSTAHSVEWYTFLRDLMGWKRPKVLEVDVPNLGVKLRLDHPFQVLENAGLGATDHATAIARAQEAEQAVANKIVAQCIDMLEQSPEWGAILQRWKHIYKMGLAWRRYDRLEWIHGVTEQQMYGSMAMKQSHELELRPKHHYPTSTRGKKGVLHVEPAPIEGFLIRLTSQRGRHQRLGKNFFKRLYFYTQNELLLFNRPARATPPHPHFFGTETGHIPSSQEIASKTPLMYDIEPFKTENGEIPWLRSGNVATIKRRDAEALEEARRNLDNISEANGYINMCRIKKEEVIKSHDDRIFELVLNNGLVVRLQAYSKDTRKTWVKRLRELIKYWKRRTTADANTFKLVRKINLERLHIDEEMEANLGQFGHKWEVNRSEASPEIYHMCGISNCRAVTLAGMLYRKPRRRGTFERCSVILSGGKMVIFQAALRKMTGQLVKHIHNQRMEVIDLQNCYVYSGLVVEDDLVYQANTFDSNKPGGGGLPRLYRKDGWTSQDTDVMTCFVVWKNKTKSWFRTEEGGGQSGDDSDSNKEGKRSKLKRVAKLGVEGRGIVFKCRSRVERDHWVLALSQEIERVVEMDAWHMQGEDYRLKAAGPNKLIMHKPGQVAAGKGNAEFLAGVPAGTVHVAGAEDDDFAVDDG
ncbi:hypothetical protein DV738_g4561, partial [Chaetothyriales sp. CBS 135597]